ncbi:2Fe-2S iron-sulfur cluster binding domain-containing protein [Coriobacteriia bacterium Es71-Z0120]|uniref:2Fe-2S iron-sulfur cluster binding domain-containing protein n=1 Tax=Parvivirga hydrogeniphila TaxID=2939460 RepID=UPI002260E0C7|nr:2Fe-2S iron-sulfur cluster binding domain-containing protein [Parvivirga hydrogeniphila]MCL4078920.1 2Fe-2S iron-sulfur cluster binding domain-containing protein [Parvivirga hydrogeniphila]
MAGCRVRFEPYGIEVTVSPGTTVLEAARKAGIAIAAQCGARGTCGQCAVRILEGQPAAIRQALGRAAALPKGMALACLAEVADGLAVRPVNAVRVG